jgi:ATP-dependent Clp protease ATP-binding subunit ClpB
VKREKDEASQKRFELINEEITALQKEIADLDEIWKAEKAQAQGSKTIMQEVEKLRFQIKELTARATSTRRASCNTASCPSWKSA